MPLFSGRGQGLDAIVHQSAPTTLELLLNDPPRFLAAMLYKYMRNKDHAPTGSVRCDDTIEHALVRVVCISDTHNVYLDSTQVPVGDILIHAGDITQSGTVSEVQDTLDWLGALPHRHKVVIAGNHDRCLAIPEECSALRWPQGVTYLSDAECQLYVGARTINIYGSPWTPKHGSGVFQYPRYPTNSAIQQWSSIPANTDILVTHGPPASHLDLGDYGCAALRDALWDAQPKLHVFGHIHAGRRVEVAKWDVAQRYYELVMARKSRWAGLFNMAFFLLRGLFVKGRKSIMVNAAVCGGVRDEDVRDAIVVDL
ncbi:hypothetical protein BOTBODRAFT_153725 [Botryobasidium botryosum FD-172 SS1]|uniref:Calcineurin-like phosphoesterase domain-containing protein n=1 Tax=Botryobasidium botryosum (strain FD-172 SS1) TaxID=930990 RepID=A0A067N421_BOTB1|nr:hypothetical protein BOTBODRAFT_153725 [Botryobasidium botryosum FD-172 SS1]